VCLLTDARHVSISRARPTDLFTDMALVTDCLTIMAYFSVYSCTKCAALHN